MPRFLLRYLAGFFFIAGIISSFFAFFRFLPPYQETAKGLFFALILLSLLFSIGELVRLSKKVSLIQTYPYLYYVGLFFTFALIAAVLGLYVLTGVWQTISMVFFYLLMFYVVFTLATGYFRSTR